MCDHCKNDRILYIYDNCWGKGYYKCGGTKSERRHVKRILDNVNDKSGVIVIRCYDKDCGLMNAFRIIEILMKQDYCGMFYMSNLYEMKLLDDVLVVKFECESG